METVRVLVTGAGSGVGQGIIKSLRLSELPITVIAADISSLQAGLYVADEAVLLPPVEQEGALPLLIKAFNEHAVDVVMVGSEFDLVFFAEHRFEIESKTKARVVVCPLETVRIADDKHETSEFLKKNGLAYAPSIAPDSLEAATTQAQAWGYPLILKSRTGTSSRNVHIVENEAQLRDCYLRTPAPMLQQMVMRPSARLENEYTCSLYRCRNGTLLGPFTSRRTVRGGTSWAVEVAEFEELHPLLYGIAEALPFLGSLNVQLGVGENGPVPFEFNARFSGTTAVRAHYGFNEPEFALLDFFYESPIPEPRIRKGIALRYVEEVFVEEVAAAELEAPLPKGRVRRWF